MKSNRVYDGSVQTLALGTVYRTFVSVYFVPEDQMTQTIAYTS
jgi:hypothetical protein